MEISPTERKAIRKMWKEGSNVRTIAAATHHGTNLIARITRGMKRNPCGCGRKSGHHGRCWFRAPTAGRVPIWTPDADDLLCKLWPTNTSNEMVAAAIAQLRDRPVSVSAVVSRARKLHLYRSKEFCGYQRKMGLTGRAKGSRNKNEYPVRAPKYPVPDTEKVKAIQDLWQSGMSRRTIADKTGVDQWTIRYCCQGIERVPCLCGRPAGQAGRFKAKADRNETERAAYERWCNRNKRWTDEADNLVRLKYPTKIQIRVLAEELSELLGHDVSDKALMQRASDLGVKRRVCVVQPGLKRVSPHAKPDDKRHFNPGRPRRTLPTQTIAIFAASNEAAKVNKAPFRMMSTQGPDPYAKLRLQQIANASKGRL
jgi:hypothetical protein